VYINIIFNIIQGLKGEPGPVSEKGQKGEPGESGLRGPQGLPGIDGNIENNYIIFYNIKCCSIYNILYIKYLVDSTKMIIFVFVYMFLFYNNKIKYIFVFQKATFNPKRVTIFVQKNLYRKQFIKEKFNT